MQSRRWWRGASAAVPECAIREWEGREGEAVPQIMLVNRMAAVNCKADMKVAVYQVALPRRSDGRTTHARLLTRINYVSLSAPPARCGDLNENLSHKSPRAETDVIVWHEYDFGLRLSFRLLTSFLVDRRK